MKIPKWAVVDGDDHQAGCAGTEVRRRFRGGFWWIWANDNKMEASQVTILLWAAKNYSAAALGASWIGLMQRLIALHFSQSDVRLRAVRFNIAPSRIAAWLCGKIESLHKRACCVVRVGFCPLVESPSRVCTARRSGGPCLPLRRCW